MDGVADQEIGDVMDSVGALARVLAMQAMRGQVGWDLDHQRSRAMACIDTIERLERSIKRIRACTAPRLWD